MQVPGLAPEMTRLHIWVVTRISVFKENLILMCFRPKEKGKSFYPKARLITNRNWKTSPGHCLNMEQWSFLDLKKNPFDNFPSANNSVIFYYVLVLSQGIMNMGK